MVKNSFIALLLLCGACKPPSASVVQSIPDSGGGSSSRPKTEAKNIQAQSFSSQNVVIQFVKNLGEGIHLYRLRE